MFIGFAKLPLLLWINELQMFHKVFKGKHTITLLWLSYYLSCVQLSSCLWRSSVSNRRPQCRVFTQTPPPCSPHTSLTAEKSVPSTILRLQRTMSSPLSREKSSLSWTIGELLHTYNQEHTTNQDFQYIIVSRFPGPMLRSYLMAVLFEAFLKCSLEKHRIHELKRKIRFKHHIYVFML